MTMSVDEQVWLACYAGALGGTEHYRAKNVANAGLAAFKKKFPEIDLREKIPAVKEAWENYQIILALHKENK